MRIDFVPRPGRKPWLASLLAIGALTSALWVPAAYAEERAADDVAPNDVAPNDGVGDGYTAPGYPKYHLGQALVERGDMKIRLHTRIELRGGYLTGADKGTLSGADNQLARGDLVEKTGFGVPRARFGLRGQFTKHVSFAIVTGLVGGRLTDAWIGYDRYRFLKMWFGARTIPFSRSAMLSSADAALSERSRGSNAMAPFRQVGVTFGGNYKLLGLGWRLGVYNGFDRGLTFYSGVNNTAGLKGNRFQGLSGVARLQVQPLGALGPSVHDLTGGKLRLSVGGGGYLNDGGGVQSTGLSADVHLKFAGVHLFAEWIRDTAEPKDRPTTTSLIPAAITRQAMSAELGYVWNRMTFAARVELIDPNADVKNNDDEMWISASVGRMLVGNLLRVWLQYDHRRELAGQPLDNDSLLFKIMLRL